MEKTGLIYYRVSTDEQATHGVSLDQQQKACRDIATRDDITVEQAFSDDGVSAKTKDRPGLQAMLEYCMKNADRIDYVIVYKIDRLSRNVNDYSSILVLLKKLNIQLLSVTEAVDETPVGKYVGNLMAATAQFDNDVRGERTKACMRTRVEQGYWCWRAPTGYRNARDADGRAIVEIDSERGPFVTWAFEQYSKGVLTLEEIRIELNRKGMRTLYGNEISPQVMSKMMRNKFYIGIMVVDEQEYQGVHDPLTDKETFMRCQARLRGENPEDAIAKKRKNEAFPLRHEVICVFCGRPLTAAFSTGKSGKKYPFYRCYYKECTTDTRSIAKQKLEAEFKEFLGEISGKKKFSKAFQAVILDVWKEQYAMLNAERERLTKKIDRLEGEKKSLINMKKKDLLPDNDFKIEFASVNEKVQREYEMLEETKLETFDVNEAVEYVFDILCRLPEVWSDADFTQKQQLQSLIFPEKPVYTYGGFETPQLSPIFALNADSFVSESTKAPVRRIELRLQE